MEYFVTKYDVDLSNADCVVLDDSIMVKGSPTTAGSKMLENFISPIDATVVKKLSDAKIPIAGKVKMDEFGASGIFMRQNAGNSEKNSRNGAVAAVLEGTAKFALCNDYTGSVSTEAVASGLCYIHPTYGTVSRYGLIASVTSMDQIGIVCKSPKEGFKLLSIIAGYDEKDGVMSPKNSLSPQKKDNLRIGIPTNLSADEINTSDMTDFASNFDRVGFELKYFETYEQVMQILCCAELSNNISRFDGIKFGHRAQEYGGLQELYTKSRTEGFDFDTKLAAIVGTMVLEHDNYDKYYDKAMRVRRLIKNSLDFEKYDAVIVNTPCPARICGLPSATIPHKNSKLTIIADAGNEDILMTIVGSGR